VTALEDRLKAILHPIPGAVERGRSVGGGQSVESIGGYPTAVGSMVWVATAPPADAAQRKGKELKSHWRNHDGRWSYWDEHDRLWYYTDGKHWFFEDGSHWKLYRFDKRFGREGFERGAYKLPGTNIKIELPTHAVFRL